MSGLIIALVLTAAVLHASWNAMVKSGGAPEYSIAAYQMVGAVVCIALVPWVPFPNASAWPFIIASALIHNVYYFTLAQCYRSGDLSLVYPLFRGLAPVLVALGAGWFTGEWISSSAMIGVGLVSFGLISLSIFSGGKARASSAAIKWGLITSVMIASYTIVDGLGVRSTDNSFSYILWLFILEPIPIVTWILFSHRQDWFAYLRMNPKTIAIGGVASSTAYGLVIFAMGLGAMALVSSLRETSVIFAALIGTLILKEPFGRQRIFAACFVAIGIIIIRINL